MSEVTVIEEQLEKEAAEIVVQAKGLVVINQETYGQMGAIITRAKKVRKGRWEYFKDLIDDATHALDGVRKKRAAAVEPLDLMIEIGTASQNQWLRAEDERKRKEQSRLEAEAREAARKEQERLQRAAEKAEAQGKTEKAEELIEKAAEVTAQPVFAAPVMSAPVKTGDTTSFTVMETEVTVTNISTFLKALVEKNHAPSMITVNVAPLKAFVKALGVETYPGLLIKKTPKARNR